jgi:alpha-mannosidase
MGARIKEIKMTHRIRWTAEKIAQCLRLVEPLVYRRRQPLAPFRYIALGSPVEAPPVGSEIDDGAWAVIEPYTYWGAWMSDFALRSHFQVPADWDPDAPVALHLPLGNAGDFSHPEALAYIDGVAYAACDRHHQEILLSARWRDGWSHWLALHGWTGLGGGLGPGEPGTHLFMRPCAVVEIDKSTRDFVATARVALGVANSLDENEPAVGHLLNALDEAFTMLETRSLSAKRFMPACQRPTLSSKPEFGELARLWMWTSSPPGTPIWTWRGCGRWARSGARPAAPSTPSCA